MPRNRGARTRLAPGIYQDDKGISVVGIAGGLPHREVRFPTGTPLDELQRK